MENRDPKKSVIFCWIFLLLFPRLSPGSCIIVYTARSSPSPTPSTSLPAAVNREISLKARLVCSTDFRYQPPTAAGNFAHLCSRNSLQLSHWKPPSSSSLVTHFLFSHTLLLHMDFICPRCMTARAARADVICVCARVPVTSGSYIYVLRSWLSSCGSLVSEIYLTCFISIYSYKFSLFCVYTSALYVGGIFFYDIHRYSCFLSKPASSLHVTSASLPLYTSHLQIIYNTIGMLCIYCSTALFIE